MEHSLKYFDIQIVNTTAILGDLTKLFYCCDRKKKNVGSKSKSTKLPYLVPRPIKSLEETFTNRHYRSTFTIDYLHQYIFFFSLEINVLKCKLSIISSK